ncbi:methyl-accepting chemotaxis protein [Candidatus Symbiopectobacterium sp. NZEC135]|uniref:methyl-accepting chemotaxis protein n=1 Tax=Candidatus Symbiopectobacterium sp. NZEC135 TaxID=2820471 RepID=UPI0022268C13|nr:methyl-accepting chemotaxis protein [Candidatus Symbiopectobacterium sp. NZEC135]MCW2478725.1 Tar ligand binding domain-containing protein [Candidatus Symbiopectobacterium sp. NZEC135]
MFKQIKVVTILVAVLLLLGFLQLVTGAVSVRALTNDKDNFLVAQSSNLNVSTFTDALMQLNQSRATITNLIHNTQSAADKNTNADVEISKSLIISADNLFKKYKSIPNTPGLDNRLSQKIEDDFTAYYTQLKSLLDALNANNAGQISALNQGVFEKNTAVMKTYREWRDVQTEISQRGATESQKAFDTVLTLLGVIMVIVILVIILSWVSIQRTLLHPLHNIMDHIKSIASGDLTLSIDNAGRNEMGQLGTNLKNMQQELIKTVSAVRDSSDSIYTGAGEIASGSNDLSSRTEQQAASLEETAASMEQLTATVKQNSDNARQASKLAQEALGIAGKGGEVVNSVVNTMSDISTSSKQIAHITAVIDGIAFQTNILALNAAVEAARAGEQGRGFAVVAGEVRTLAQRSAQAAKEIKSLIDDSVNRVATGSNQVQEAGNTMSEIVNSVTRVADIMGEIASASDEQSRGIDQVGEAVAQMDSVTQQNAALVEESATAAAALEEQAQHLKDAVSAFKLTNSRTSSSQKNVSPSPLLIHQSTIKSADKTANANWEQF